MTAPPKRPAVLDWVLVAFLSGLSGVIGVYGVFLLPAYAGSTPMPVIVVVIGLALWVIPRVSYRLTGHVLAAVAPVLLWLATTIWLYFVHNALYLNVPISWQGWQFALLVGVGVLVSAASIGLVWGDHLSAEIRLRAERAGLQTVGPRSEDGKP